MSHDCIAKTILPGFHWKIQYIQYFKKNSQLIQNNLSNLLSGKWTVLSRDIRGKKYGMEIKFMSRDCIAKTISLDFSEKFKIYSILKIITSLYIIILVNFFQVNGRSLEQILWKKICGMEIKFMRHDFIAKPIFPGFQWKIQNILYIKNNNQLIQYNFSKLFSGKWTVLSLNILEKNICRREIKFMSHDCIATTIFPGFQWKIQNIQYF